MNADFDLQNAKIAVIGLGYVGLPLAVEFAKKYKVTGFDININRINALKAGFDATREVDDDTLKKVLVNTGSNGLVLTNINTEIQIANIYIITVPTPVDKYNHPDLTPLYRASETAGKVLKKGDVVIYESTVYPGVTEDECVPVLERFSGLKFNVDFFVGYSPERINPGDKEHTLTRIKKVTAGSTPATADVVDNLYKSIIVAGTHKAPSIKVAEAAKVIENSQRDINIAFVNELSKIFCKLGIDTKEVLDAAATKWNFLRFSPGLVGGHCIGVDPYYLSQKAQEVGYHPEIILAGRKLNDGMGEYIAHEVIKLMVKKDIPVKGANVLILGITFKENCPDIRNTRVVDIVHTLTEFDAKITVYDPLVNCAEVEHEYGLKCVSELEDGKIYNAVILAVAHAEFKVLDIEKLCSEQKVIYDVKSVLPKELSDARL
jgi:UDP-N-acetyl-D-galactosamine dehydrogenase